MKKYIGLLLTFVSSVSFGSAIIQDGSVTTPKIADLAVTTAKINSAAVTTAKINNAAVTTAKTAGPNQVTSASSGGFGTTSTTYVSVTNLSISVATIGHPVMILLASDATGNPGEISIVSDTTTAGIGYGTMIQVLKGGSTVVGTLAYSCSKGASTGAAAESCAIPTTGIWIDTPSAGTTTYSVTEKCTSSSGVTSCGLKDTLLIAFEMY